jgi:P-type Ca2+ transporter type 2C
MVGVASAELADRLQRFGPNRLVPLPRRAVVPRWLWRAITDPMAILLMLAVPIYLTIGDRTDALITLAALVPVVGIGWLLESRAEHALDRLRAMTAATAVVWRDGAHHDTPIEQIVPDDIVVLREGDVVPADAVFVLGTQMMVDEAALTGESQPVTKETGDEVFAGTTVLSGRGLIRVTVTGLQTRHGTIGRLVADVKESPTPLQRTVARLVHGIGMAAGVFCVLVVAVERIRGRGWGDSLIAGIALAIAAIPEEFPMVYTLYLGLGAWRLTKEHALVRRLAGVETLGSTTAICSDKTGTLTLGALAVSRVATDRGEILTPASAQAHALLEAALLACEPDPFDPLERAIVAAASEAGIDIDALHNGELIADYPFDSHGKYLTHVWRFGQELRIAAKGSVETIGAFGGADASELHQANEALAADGLRVIGVAAGSLHTTSGDRRVDERALRICGLVGFSDPLRPGVADALLECASAGIRVVMITGDHPVTAHAVAEGLGLAHHDETGENEIATGDQLDAGDESAVRSLVDKVNVFARMRPEQKHRLIEALHARGDVVAMTGDGINDAPALREADIGIAMGQRGTAVARESATIVLLDDNFATIVSAVRNGRRIVDNLLRAFDYLIAFHIPLLLTALVVPLLGHPLLLLPVHLVLLELVVHPVVSLVFENDPADADLMSRPPRAIDAGMLGRASVSSAALGSTLSITVVGLYVGALMRDVPEERARGIGFTTLLLGQAVLILAARSRGGIWRAQVRGNRALLPALASVVLLAVVCVQVAPVADALRLAPLRIADWVVVVSGAAAATCWRRGGAGGPVDTST